MRSVLLVLALLIVGAPVAAQEHGSSGWKLNGKDATPDTSQAMQGGFGALMLVTPDYEAFLKAWAGSSPPSLPTTDQVTREKPVHVMLLFSGCRAGRDGNCNVTAQFGITAPNGSPYGEVMAGRVWNGPPAPAYNLQLAESGIGFALEREDPLGTYIFKAAVTDNVAGTTLTLEKTVSALLSGR